MKEENKTAPAKCPHCGRVLINRIVDFCQYCSAELPLDLRLSEAEKAPLRERLRKDVEREEQGRSRTDRATTSPDGWSPAFMGLYGGAGGMGGDFGGGGDCGDGGGGGCD